MVSGETDQSVSIKNPRQALVKSNFWFRFRFFIYLLDEKAEAEPKIALDKYNQYDDLNWLNMSAIIKR